MKNILDKPKQILNQNIAKRPFGTFLTFLIALIILLLVGKNLGSNTKKPVEEKVSAKEVAVINLNSTPSIEAQAQIKKSGVVTLVAQTAGVVQEIYGVEGKQVQKNQRILWISTTYSGQTLSSAQRQQAEANYNFNKNNYETQKDLITKQRQAAELNRANADELRKITEQSISDSKGINDVNYQLINSIDNAINSLVASGGTEEQINQLKSQKLQLIASAAQVSSGIRANEYSTNKDNAPNNLAESQLQITQKQLDIQEKSISLQLEVSRLTLSVAQINESLNYPSSPFSGTIEHINVSTGQMINPGQELATIKGTKTNATAEIFVTKEVASQLSRTKESTLIINSTIINIVPSYIATQPTNGSLYNVTLQIPQEYADQVDNGAFVTAKITLEIANNVSPYIPLDSIYQTQDGAYIYVANKNDKGITAKSKKITLGQVAGKFIEVKDGLDKDDAIITDRNITEGDSITIKEQ